MDTWDRLDPYFSAVEEAGVAAIQAGFADQPGMGVQSPAPSVAPGRGVQEMLEQLLSQAEVTQRTVTGLQQKFKSIDQLDQRLSKLEGKPAAANPTQAAAAPQLFNMNQAAINAEQLTALQALAGRGPTRVGDLGLKTLNRPNPANPPLEPDDGAEPEEAVEEEPEDKDIKGIQPTSTLEQVLLSQTRILKQLAQNRSQSSDPLTRPHKMRTTCQRAQQ